MFAVVFFRMSSTSGFPVNVQSKVSGSRAYLKPPLRMAGVKMSCWRFALDSLTYWERSLISAKQRTAINE